MKRLSPDIIFKSEYLSKDLARKSVRGGMTTMAAQGIQFALNIVGTMILARLLTPKDYGLVGMVTVVVNFAAMFKDAGLSMATIQKDKISPEQISTLFWINVIISAFLGFCVLICSPLVAWFYSKPELTAVTAALSISFIITGLTIQHRALIRRHMQFGTLAIVQISSYLMNLVVAIILALLGFRYWAIVGGTIATALSSTLITLFFCPWLPGRMKKGTGVRDMLKFGVHLTGFDFVNYFSRNADNMLIGKFLGADALGLYAKAYQIFMMPINQIRTPINNVSVPALCAIRNDHARYRNYYRKIIFLISFINMPLVGFLIIFAENIIILILGKQWIGAVLVFQILAVTGFIQSAVQAGRGLPLLSMGFSRRYLYFGILQSIVTVIGFVIGLHWGIIGVAAGYGIAFYLLIPFTIVWCLKGSPVTISDWMLAISSPILATLVMIPFMILIKDFIQHNVKVIDLPLYANLKVTFIGGTVGMVVYALGVFSLPIGRENLSGGLQLFRQTLKNRRDS